MNGLSSAWPAPRRLSVAGRIYRVPQLRLRDLAELEQIEDDADAAPEPPVPEGLEGEALREELARRYLSWIGRPRPFDSAASLVARRGRLGLAWLLEVLGPRCVPAIDSETAAGLAAGATADEAGALAAAAMGDHPGLLYWHALNALDGWRIPPESGGSWIQAAWDLATATGMPIDAIGDIPVGAWRRIAGAGLDHFRMLPPRGMSREAAAGAFHDRLDRVRSED